MIDRRSLIAALGAAVAAGLAPGRGLAEAPLFAGCRMDGKGAASLALFDLDGREVFATELPARGHDVAVSPDGRTLVAFARRPGTWAAVVDRATGRVERTLLAGQGRHFYGHGAFSADGAVMMATENDLAGGDGLVGLYDPRDGWRRIGEVPSRGVGPHDIAPMPGGDLVAVANGGIRTHPESGRDMLNLDTMRPNLALLGRDGRLVDAFELPDTLRLSSLRHIAVAPDGTIGFGCQHVGPREDAPDLVGILAPGGRLELLPIPEDDNLRFDDYIGSVAFDRSGDVLCATGPQGGVAGFWDVRSRRFLGSARMPDVCGVAAAPAARLFLLTSGNAGVRLARAEPTGLDRLPGAALDRWVWDNHLVAL